MRDDYQKKIADKIAARYIDLELRIMEDIVRRIKKTGEITSTADWQINRLKIPSYAYENFCQMYEAYHRLGGNGMVEKMHEEIQELHLKRKGD